MPKRVFISSTFADLKEHRAAVQVAVRQLGAQDVSMEYFGARDERPLDECLRLIRETSDIFVGIYAHRRGFVPEGSEASITELEYNAASAAGLKCLIYILDKSIAWKPCYIDENEAGRQQEDFKKRLSQNHICEEFSSPDKLATKVAADLGRHFSDQESNAEPKPQKQHMPPNSNSEMSRTKPQAFGHTYSLMEVHDLIGRREELSLLNDWAIATSAEFRDVSTFVLTAIGGMGKSALFWHWLSHEAPKMAGHIWWSFYDVPSFDQFVVHSLHYVTGKPLDQLQALFPKQRNEAYDQLFEELNNRPYLLSLDGLERILVAYASLDAAYLTDKELETRSSFQSSSLQSRLPTSTPRDYLRRCIEPMAGEFLRRLSQLRNLHEIT